MISFLNFFEIGSVYVCSGMTYEELFKLSDCSRLIPGDLRVSMLKMPRDES